MKILPAFFSFSSMTLISRFFGLLRDWMFVRFFGTSEMMDAFIVAYKIPHFFRRLFAEGAFSQAFIPVLTTITKNEKTRAESDDFIACISTRLFIWSFCFCLLGMVISPLIVILFAPGYIDKPDQLKLTGDLLKLSLPYLPLIVIVSFLSALLNSIGRFTMGAFVPVILNVALILSTLYLSPHFSPSVEAPMIGLLIGGVLQVGFMLYAAHKKNLLRRPRFSLSPTTKIYFKKFRRLFIPLIASAGVIQLGLLMDVILASTLAEGSISWLYYGQRLFELPNGLFIISIGTVILPSLSALAQKNTLTDLQQGVNKAISVGIFIILPSTLGLVFLALPIVSILFEHGPFTRLDSIRTADALMVYALSLPAFVLIKIYSTVFFALNDARIPLRCLSISVVVNLVFSLILINYYQHVGLAIATSIATWINVAFLGYFLTKNHGIQHFPWDKQIFKILLSCLLLGILIYVGKQTLFVDWLTWSKIQQTTRLFLFIGSVIALYALLCYITKIEFKQWLEWKTELTSEKLTRK